MSTALKTALAATLALSALAGTASAQQANNIGIAPVPGPITGPAPTPVVGCPIGSTQQISIDAYGRQVITCVYYQNRPINPVGAIIGGIVGGIIAGGHR